MKSSIILAWFAMSVAKINVLISCNAQAHTAADFTWRVSERHITIINKEGIGWYDVNSMNPRYDPDVCWKCVEHKQKMKDNGWNDNS